MAARKIAINGLAMRSARHGVGNYISSLARELVQSHPRDQFHFFIRDDNNDLPDLLGSYSNVSFEKITLPIPLRLIWEQLVLPFKVGFGKYDVLHCPVHILPLLKTTRYVVTELDLTFFLEPAKHTLPKRYYFRLLIPLTCAVADKILSISHSTARDLERVLGVNKSKIVVTPLAPDPQLAKVSDSTKLAQVRKRYHLPTQFILFLGVLEPRKNVVGLLEAYAKISAQVRSDLVIAGSNGYGWNQQEVYTKLRQPDLKNRVHLIGPVEEADKAALFSLAELFIYPSFYEGFGIPVLEAMRCGVPVVTSSGSSLEEVAGGAAALIDPYNIREIADKIKQLSGNPKLRQQLSRRGLANSKRFNWKKTAKLTYGAYLG